VRFVVVTTDEAQQDLDRLTDVMIERAQTVEDFDRALWAVQVLRSSMEALSDSALRCRKAGDGRDPFLRELVIPFGRSGYLALFEIVGDRVVVAAIRHQLEDDYH
jgi:plasmid stabilization system protein ParE